MKIWEQSSEFRRVLVEHREEKEEIKQVEQEEILNSAL